MKLTIRRVSLLEVDRLRDFMEATFRSAFEHMNEPRFFEPYCAEAFSLEAIVGELAAPQSEFWFALLEEDLAGYMKLNFDQHPRELANEKTVQIERLYLMPEFQGQKLGQRLLVHAEVRAKKFGGEWLWLSAWQENPAAVRFYERHGFEIFCTEVFDIGDDPQTDWLLKKRLEA